MRARKAMSRRDTGQLSGHSFKKGAWTDLVSDIYCIVCAKQINKYISERLRGIEKEQL